MIETIFSLAWIFAVVKIFELIRLIRWLRLFGEAYRLDVVSNFEPGKVKNYKNNELHDIMKEHNYPMPFFVVLKERYKERYILPPVVHNILAHFLDRTVTIIIVLALLLLLFPDQHLNLSYIDGGLVIVVALLQLVYLLLARCTLGFSDNFRLDFSLRGAFANVKEELPHPISRSHFLSKFMFGISVFLFSVAFAFACIYYSIYTLSYCGQEMAFHGVNSDRWVFPQFFYFSLVTLATVGFGDIFPQTFIAQAYVAIEILVGLGSIVFLLFSLSTTFSFDKNLDS